MSGAGLQVRALGCTVGNRRLFEALDFAVPCGSWTMLTGTSGSGKSTLLRIVAGLMPPSDGTVLWMGPERGRGDPAWHGALDYQGHASGWKDQLSTRENLAMQAWLDVGQRSAQALDAALELTGLMRQRRLPFTRLSAGQRRRLGLARLALSTRPLWLLDEPTTALDSDGQALFAGLLDEHLARGGCALVATHLGLPVRTEALSLRLGATS